VWGNGVDDVEVTGVGGCVGSAGIDGAEVVDL